MILRECDKWGCGHFGARRGARTHNGVDMVVTPGDNVFCFNDGQVTKIGYCYGDDLSFRYVQITDELGWSWRYFYVDPVVNMFDIVTPYTQIGYSMALGHRYPGITEHVHLEIISPFGKFINPTGIVEDR